MWDAGRFSRKSRMLPFQHFSRYWQALLRLPYQERYSKAELRREQFLLLNERGLDVYYPEALGAKLSVGP